MTMLENDIAKILTKNKLTISVAESCTGGLISNRLTNIPGASKYFKLGVVAYSNRAKSALLKVPPLLIKRKGAVSKEVALELAKGVLKSAKTDLGLGITGIAGPTGGTKFKPVGLVYIAVASRNKMIVKKYNFNGGRIAIRKKASDAALKLLYRFCRDEALPRLYDH